MNPDILIRPHILTILITKLADAFANKESTFKDKGAIIKLHTKRIKYSTNKKDRKKEKDDCASNLNSIRRTKEITLGDNLP